MTTSPRTAEGHGATVDEAIQDALGQVDLTVHDVTVEILATGGRRGLFGGGRRAHVRVTAKSSVAGSPASTERAGGARASTQMYTEPTDDQEVAVASSEQDQHVAETDDAQPHAGEENDERAELTKEEWLDLLDQEAELAADFVEGLLDRLDLPGDLEIEVHEDQAIVNIQDLGSGLLIGRRGATLDALQELVRSAVQRQTTRRSHVRVDVENYRARQLEKLRDKCREAIAEVRETGEPVRLEPMDSYERKMMHDIVSKTGGVTSSSEGNEPRRRVVILPE